MSAAPTTGAEVEVDPPVARDRARRAEEAGAPARTEAAAASREGAIALRPAALLLHREPFLFVDHAEVDDDALVVRSARRFDAGERFFDGHFPGEPIVPGVLLVEFIAQSANLLMSHRAGRVVRGHLVGIEDVRFNASVSPGDTVTAEVRFARGASPTQALEPGRITAFQAVGFVNGRRCLRATVLIHHAP